MVDDDQRTALTDGGEQQDSDEDELVQTSHMVPKQHREAASRNTEYGGVTEAVREVYRLLAEGADLDTVRLEMKLHHVEREKSRVEKHIEDLQDELSYLEDREKELSERIEKHASKETEYDVLMRELEQELENGHAVFVDHGKVQRAAESSDKTPSEIIAVLKRRCPDVPPELFTEQSKLDTDVRSDRFSSVSSYENSDNN